MHASDIVVGVRRGLVWLCASVHAPPNVPLVLRWHPARAVTDDEGGEPLVLEGVTVGAASRSFVTVSLADPGDWGCQVGANERGVAIAASPVAVSTALGTEGLRGTALVRLGLERGPSARGALDVIVELLERHGQRADGSDHGSQGGADGAWPGGHRSCCMLVADAGEAYLLETAGRRWAVDRVTASRAVCGALSIPGFADRHGDWLRAAAARASARARRGSARSAGLRRTSELFGLLRDHGDTELPTPLRWLGAAPPGCCRHASVRSPEQTAGSWLSELGPGLRHWTTGSSSPCVGLFKPIRPDEPLALRDPVAGLADDESLWWRHERLWRALARDPGSASLGRIAERDDAELRWAHAVPSSAEAFAWGDALLRRWWAEVASTRDRDRRSWADRRYWRALDRRAGLSSS